MPILQASKKTNSLSRSTLSLKIKVVRILIYQIKHGVLRIFIELIVMKTLLSKLMAALRTFPRVTYSQRVTILTLALRGTGFIEILTPQGVRYTRKGALSISNEGRLITDQGFPVLKARTSPRRKTRVHSAPRKKDLHKPRRRDFYKPRTHIKNIYSRI